MDKQNKAKSKVRNFKAGKNLKINLAQCAVEATELGWMLTDGPAHEWQRVVDTGDSLSSTLVGALPYCLYKNVTGLKKKMEGFN